MIGFSNLTRKLRWLRDDQRGAALIELAIVAPVLVLAVMGIIDVSNGFSRKLALEQGAQRAIEKIMQTTQDETVDNTVKKEAVCQVNGTNTDGTCKTGLITSSDVTVTYRLECTSSSGAMTVYTGVAAATDCPSGHTQAQYVSVNVQGKYSPMFPFKLASLNADGTYHVSATAGMRTQ
ncbi:MAG TPA: TadE/TadG family type IV pilus assembly protein [Sphingomicrobium sp.]|jgi:Flp pilus assembly protein TadG